MVKALIFDLDNCLAPADEVGEALFAPAFTAIRQANDGTVSEDQLDRAFAACWRHALDRVARDYGFSGAMLQAGWAAFRKIEVRQPMRGYGDLDVLEDLPALRFLVTSGFRRLQESKIRALQLERRMNRIYVDAIDEPPRLGKQELFARILREFDLQPEQVLAVGDDPESEITAAAALGMGTVQILRPGVPRGHNAGHYVHSLGDLKRILHDAGPP